MHKQAGKLASVSRKLVKKDPKAAYRAARAALALDPTNKKAAKALEAARGSLGNLPQELLGLPSMSGWKGLTAKNWPRKDDVLVGQVDNTAMILNTHKVWSGNYDIVMDARLVEHYGKKGPPVFSIIAPLVSQSRYVSFGYGGSIVELYEWTALRDGVSRGKKAYADIPGNPDPKDWNKYELRLRDKEIIALVNGNEVARQPRPPELGEGQIAIKVQFTKIEVRSLVLTER